jgi:oligopeptidase B
MRPVRLCALTAFLVMTLPAQTIPTPPAAPVREHRETRHGATVVDPYFWLREKSNPEVVQYLEEENAYTRAMTAKLKPFEDKLYMEMLGRIKQTDLAVPARRGEYFYYTRTEEGKQYPIHCRRQETMEAPFSCPRDGRDSRIEPQNQK